MTTDPVSEIGCEIINGTISFPDTGWYTVHIVGIISAPHPAIRGSGDGYRSHQ